MSGNSQEFCDHMQCARDIPYCRHCDIFGSHIREERLNRDSFANRARDGTRNNDDKIADYLYGSDLHVDTTVTHDPDSEARGPEPSSTTVNTAPKSAPVPEPRTVSQST